MVLKTSNMATTPGQTVPYALSAFVPTPKTYNIGDNVEEFLEEMNRFYELTQIQGPLQNTFIKAFLSAEAVKKYEMVDESIENYSERTRKAFEIPQNLGRDLFDALKYRKGNDPASKFFKTIDIMVEKILRHDITKESLTNFLLQNAIEDMDTKKEIKLRNANKIEEMKEIITKMEEIKKDINEESAFAAMKTSKKSYANAVQTPFYNNGVNNYNRRSTREQRNDQTQRYERRNEVQRREAYYPRPSEYSKRTDSRDYKKNPETYDRRFQDSNKQVNKGYQRNFPDRKCWACGEEGHVKLQCPNVRCSHCKRSGHWKHQCYESRVQGRERSRHGVAAIEDDERDNERRSDQEFPNDDASTQEEVLGAIN
jgi:hypothetical protein